jgi:tripartite-type tricarboxylate transporter receptor subunit TctC
MKLPSMRRLSALRLATAFSVLAAVAGASASSAQAQSRQMKIIVPSTPGGGGDTLARLLGDVIGRAQDQTIIVENRPGAGNTIGMDYASRQAPDGNSLLITSPEFVIGPHLRKLNWDPIKSFEPICHLVNSPQIIVVHPSSPYKTLKDMIDAAKAKPGDVTFAAPGPASAPHIAIESIKRLAGVDMTYVPYQGAAPSVNAVIGNHVTAVMVSYPNVIQQIKSGQLRALAVTSLTRAEGLPDVPTMSESGFKDFQAELWFGVVAPAKTPKEVLTQLEGWFTEAMKLPEVKAKLEGAGLFPAVSCGTPQVDFHKKELESYGTAIKASNIKIQ